MAPLAIFAADLRTRRGATPDLDPEDGGVEAEVLLLLETPGPKVGATGLVSADNPTGTGANLRRFCAQAGLDRRRRAIWNAVPWVIHAPGALNRAPRPAEVREGLAELDAFLALLPRLRAVVLAGRTAASAAPHLARLRPDLPVHACPHPSPTYVCTRPDIPGRIVEALAAAART